MSFSAQELGKQIAALRIQKGMTQEELGERLGKSKSAISNYENGFNIPTFPVMLELARIFNVNLSFLAGESDLQTRFNQFSMSRRMGVYGTDRAQEIFSGEGDETRNYIDLPHDCNILKDENYIALKADDNLFSSVGVKRQDYMIVKREDQLSPRFLNVIAVKNHIMAGKITLSNGFFSVFPTGDMDTPPMRFHAQKDEVRIVGRVVKTIRNESYAI